jgi:hypothetical protein
MCGGEIVDEKWKLSFQGALSSTVATAFSSLCANHANAVASSCCASGTSRVIASRTADSQAASAINDRNAATAPSNRAVGKDPSRGVSPSALPAATPEAKPMAMMGWCIRQSSEVALRTRNPHDDISRLHGRRITRWVVL